MKHIYVYYRPRTNEIGIGGRRVIEVLSARAHRLRHFISIVDGGWVRIGIYD